MYCRSGLHLLVLLRDLRACVAQVLGDSHACSPCRPQLLRARADVQLSVLIWMSQARHWMSQARPALLACVGTLGMQPVHLAGQ